MVLGLYTVKVIDVLRRSSDPNVVGAIDSLAAVIPRGEQIVEVRVTEDDRGLHSAVVGHDGALSDRCQCRAGQ